MLTDRCFASTFLLGVTCFCFVGSRGHCRASSSASGMPLSLIAVVPGFVLLLIPSAYAIVSPPMALQPLTRSPHAPALTALSRAGELRPSTLGFKPRQLRQELTKAKKLHSQARTPYGTVVQTVDVPSEKHPKWEICHPLAMLHYLATLSTAFFDLMSQVVAAAPLAHKHEPAIAQLLERLRRLFASV